MSLIVGKVLDSSVEMNVHTPSPLYTSKVGVFPFLRTSAVSRTIDVTVRIAVEHMPLDNTHCIYQLRGEIVCDINEAIGDGNKRPGAVLIEQLQTENSKLIHRATKAEKEVVRLQKIIDDFQQSNTQLLMNSSALRELSRKQESKKK